eukprot:738722-Pelagomonas_calceolata.AAC.3
MQDEHTRQLNAKESEVLRLKNEKKRGIWSSNQKLTYEQILEMSKTSEERESVALQAYREWCMNDTRASCGVAEVWGELHWKKRGENRKVYTSAKAARITGRRKAVS